MINLKKKKKGKRERKVGLQIQNSLAASISSYWGCVCWEVWKWHGGIVYSSKCLFFHSFPEFGRLIRQNLESLLGRHFQCWTGFVPGKVDVMPPQLEETITHCQLIKLSSNHLSSSQCPYHLNEWIQMNAMPHQSSLY